MFGADFSPLDGLSEKTIIRSRGNSSALLQGGPKIVGPWLWVVLPGEGFHNGKDLLAQASGGKVTELSIATEGATAGEPVGNNVWTSHKIDPNGHNTPKLVSALGIDSSHRHRVMYGSIILHSHTEQQTTMFAGSDNDHKVWLNSKLVNEQLVGDWAGDYQEYFPVRLKQGKNVLLVAVFDYEGGWGGAAHFGFAPDTEYTVSLPGPRFSFSTPATQVKVGDRFTVQLKAENITDLAGWQGDVVFDPVVLKVHNVREGSFLKQNGGRTHFLKGTIDNTTGRIDGIGSARISEGGISGEGTLLSLTFTAKANGESRLSLRKFQAGSSLGEVIASRPPDVIITVEGRKHPASDVNQDGQVNIQDLVLVAQYLGGDASSNPQADVNDDGVINILDLVVVAQHLGESTTAAAPSDIATIDNLELNPAMVEAWIAQAEVENDGSLVFQQGIENLQRLLASLLPEKTALLPNYPNPFNPETWIPYHLAEPAEVKLGIYAADGVLVRTLALGHQVAGIYQSRTRAAYWDGKNVVGESVASGVYFYTFTAGDFMTTRKMLIRK